MLTPVANDLSLSLLLLFFGSVFLPVARGTNHFAGMVASNAIGNQATYTCRTQEQWNTVARDVKGAGMSSLRITGFNCNALDRASAAAASYGLTVLAGIYFSGTVAANQAAIDNDVAAFTAAYKKYGKGRYLGLAIGNEASDSGANLMKKVNSVRTTLRASGITTPVSSVHIWTKVQADNTFCQGDFVGANAHAFYDGKVAASAAGDFVHRTVVPALKATCPGKQIIITESGWPSRGSTNSVATASLTNEKTALAALNCAAQVDSNVSIFAFEYDDQAWKTTDNERSFGIFGKLDFSTDIANRC